MAGKNDNFDALMAMMALKHIMDGFKRNCRVGNFLGCMGNFDWSSRVWILLF